MRPEHWLYTIPLRLRSLFRRAQADQELDDALRDHVERKPQEYIGHARVPAEARRQAVIEMGGIEKRKEECRDVRRVRWLQDLAQDLRFGLRVLRKSPSFTAIAVLSLALGTGANTAIFQLIDSLRLRTLPVAHAEQLANVRILDRSWSSGRVHGRYADITNAQWEQIRDHQQVFSRMFAWAAGGGEFHLTRDRGGRYA